MSNDSQPARIEGYAPTSAEQAALAHVNRVYEASKRYWDTKHQVMKGLYARYLNAKLFTRSRGLSNEQIGQTYRVATILHSLLSDIVLGQKPFGKIEAQGEEDYWGKEIIDKTHAWQQNQTYLKNVLDSALLYSVVCGAGVVMPGWEHKIRRYYAEEPVTTIFANPSDPLGEPMEIPTGQMNLVEKMREISRIDGKLIQSWNVFPSEGATDPLTAHDIIFRVKMSKNELRELERAGEIRNVDKIPKEAYGLLDSEQYIDETDVYNARREEAQQADGGDNITILFCYSLFPYFNYEEHEADPQLRKDDEYECIIIKPQDADIILNLDLNRLACASKPCVVFKYDGFDDMFFGFSPLEVAIRLLQLDEDMFNMTQDAAKRELQRRTFVMEGINHADLSPGRLDGIVRVNKGMAETLGGVDKMVYSEPATPYLMPNLIQQREVVFNLIDEITGVIDFVRGTSTDEDETATKTAQRTQFINKRFKKRIQYFEDNGLWWWMQWQTVLNAQFLPDETVEKIAGIPAALNPFRNIEAIIPIESFDFVFEGSTKAVEDPVQAQILGDILDRAGSIPPGFDENGELKEINSMAIFRLMLKKLNVTDDMELFFNTVTPEELAMRQMSSAGGGKGSQGLGAVTPGDMLAGLPKTGAGIRKEA